MTIRDLGLGNGALAPISVSTQLQVQLPSDNREEEVSSALTIVSVMSLYVALQAFATLNSDLHPWATLVGSIGALAATADAIFRKGQFLRAAAQGIERLTVRDEEREEFLDASGFVLGYILGLPCFAFQPDLSEALKLLTESPEALDAYKLSVDKRDVISGSSSGSGTSKSRINPSSSTIHGKLDGLGRVLVWLMAPIAAEVSEAYVMTSLCHLLEVFAH